MIVGLAFSTYATSPRPTAGNPVVGNAGDTSRSFGHRITSEAIEMATAATAVTPTSTVALLS